jgi:hypothetical protein
MDKLINEILQNLTHGTINNEVEWKLNNSAFNSDTCKQYETNSSDGKTRFVVEIDLDEKFNLLKNRTDFHIYNSDLINGRKFLYSDRCPDIIPLGEAIFKKYLKSNIQVKDESSALENILGSIFSKEHKRDQRIDSILGIDDEKKSFIEKLFGK